MDSRMAVNAIIGGISLFSHHAVFFNFSRHTINSNQELYDPITKEQLVIDFLGMKTKREFFCSESYYRQRVAHALRVGLCDFYRWASKRDPSPFPVTLNYPTIGEEYFEYIDVLESVVHYTQSRPTRPYRFVEIGAGYGHWTMTAHAALKKLISAPKYEFLLVELDHAKQRMLRSGINLNDVSPDHAKIVRAAVGENNDEKGVLQRGSEGMFGVFGCLPHMLDKAAVQNCKHETSRNVNGKLFAPLKTLKTLLQPYNKIDMIDIDVQGAEYFVLNNETLQTLDRKVLRVHIGTHGAAPVPGRALRTSAIDTLYEKELYRLFLSHGWLPRFIMGVTNQGCSQPFDFRVSHWGPVCMADGAMSFVNSRFVR